MNEEEIFQSASVLSAAERSRFLRTACQGQSALQARVERLLASHDNVSFMEGAADRPASMERAAENARAKPEECGDRIGNYKLLEQIGEGGCGVVYLAQQDQPVRRTVALKVIKLGMDTRSVIARFEQERQALALMDHPNIAKVLDAGATPLGRPFFVMELVRGVRITEYCEQNILSVLERVKLVISICQAIQHAHQKGIIHRDIKPSNILVTLHDGVPVAKVIDFGIAKATTGQSLTDKTLFTAFEQFVGTPAYMSPEQAEMSGLDVDTRSDIYSLGVLLYELLTGQTPFDGQELISSGLAAMRKTICEKEPQRPSTKLTRKLLAAARTKGPGIKNSESEIPDDLDWIVMKCLEKDRTRRYETANGLASDLKRHLHNEPVVARPPTAAYKLQKAWRRNKLVFTAAGAVLCALILGVVVSAWQAVRATQAEREQSRLRKEADELRANEARLRLEAEARATFSQANFLLLQAKFEEAEKLIGGISRPINQSTVEGAAVFRALGDWHAVAGRWREAAARFATALELNHFDSAEISTMDFLKGGPLMVELGDLEGYERLRQTAIARFTNSQDMFTSERIVKVSLLLPAGDEMCRSLAPLAASQTNAAFNSLDRQQSHMAAWSCLSLALMEFRMGHYALAAEWCRRCLAFPPESKVRIATARIVLASSHRELHQTGAAQSELAQAREIVEDKFRSELGPGEGILGKWYDWFIARILLREATALIESQPSGSTNPKPQKAGH